MAQTINVGTEINLDDLIQSRMLIQANSGGGKSVTARVIMEESFGKVPFITFDRDGEYYTLKEAFPDVIVIGGSFPDLALSMQSAALLPKEIVSNRLSVVIDLSDLKSGEKQTYVRDFLSALMDLPQSHWTPYLVFIEEAHFFCGEQDKNPAGPAVRELMAGGRKKGYCGILITQRISKLHKDAAAEANNKFVGRTNLDIDMDRAARELGFNDKEKRLALRDLNPGHFFVYGTSIEPHHVHQVKIKLPRTKQPKAGTVTSIKPGKPNDKVLSALQKLNDLPKEAAKEKKTIADLQAENDRLKNELSNKPKAVVGNADALQIRNEELTQRIESWRNKYNELEVKYVQAIREVKSLRETVSEIDTKLANLKDLTSNIVKRQEVVQQESAVNEPVITRLYGNRTTVLKTVQRPSPVQLRPTSTSRPAGDIPKGGNLGKCAMAILTFLASFPDRAWSKAQVGIATGYSPSSGGFNNALSELNSKGVISRDGGKLQATNGAAGYLPGDFQPQAYSIETFKSKLGKCEREIYEAVLDQPDRWFTKPDLAGYTPSNYSPTSGGFNNALSTLNTLELIERKNGEVRLNPELLEI